MREPKLIGNDWDIVLRDEYNKDYFYELLKSVQKRYSQQTIFPPKDEVFKAFRYTPYKDVKVLYDDLHIDISMSGSLHSWAKEGVLLLNAVLTVVKDSPASMRGIGWETFTDEVIRKINEKETPVVFILWGGFARSKKKLITNPRHLVLESVHPSPLSAYNGFFGSRPFSKTNEFLIKNHMEPIDWQIK